MDNKEIALQIVLALIEKGAAYPDRNDSKSETLGKIYAELYNAVLANLSE